MVDLGRRSSLPELMDGEDVPQAEFDACMRDLAQVNTLTLARRPTLAFVAEALAATPRDTVPLILDVGFGAGDMLRAIRALCDRKGRNARLVGIDLNPRSRPVALAMTAPEADIDYRTGDLYDWPKTEPVNIVLSSLVTHHMSDAEVVRFLRWMEEHALLGWFVNDLHRHAIAYHGFRALAAAMRWHPFVRHDGPLSIARAFRHDDWRRYLREAELEHVGKIAWRLPFRYCVARRKW